MAEKLPAQKRSRRSAVPEKTGRTFSDPSPAARAGAQDPPSVSSPAVLEGLQSLAQKLAELERRLDDKCGLLNENQRLLDQLHEQQHELARKNAEIEKLQRDLLYQKRLVEKELQDTRKAMDDRAALLERQCQERISREREMLQERWALQEKHLEERLEWEKERYSLKLLEVQQREGFWSKLVRMLTWS
ncbi:MAG: hypothetical protein KBH99_09245 [Syntrophobacteraceae bacterium]|nr:hypothetical protein [Syntrophobacteraceae bacterium]